MKKIILTILLIWGFSSLLQAQTLETKIICPGNALPDGSDGVWLTVDKFKCNDCCSAPGIVHRAVNIAKVSPGTAIEICPDLPFPKDWKVVGGRSCRGCCGTDGDLIMLAIRKTGVIIPPPPPPPTAVHILRFNGMSGQYQVSDQTGGPGGTPFELIPPPGAARVRAIIVYSHKPGLGVPPRVTGYVEGLQLEWDMKDGRIVSSPKVGSVSAGTEHVVDFAKDEFITNIEGRSGVYVDNLLVKTNKRELTFGGGGGDLFYFYQSAECPAKGVSIMGLVGKAGIYIDSIGVVGNCL